MTAKVPHHYIMHICMWYAKGVIDFKKSIDRAVFVDLKIHVKDLAFRAWEAKPWYTLRYRYTQLEHKEGFPSLAAAADQHLVTLPEDP